MAKSTGILLDDNMELVITPVRDLDGLITSGLVVGNVTFQNQKILINATKGEIKEDPMSGVGASNYVESNDSEGFVREIRSQLTRDGQRVKSISVKIPAVRLEASYD
jgi:hypothetical protein